MPFTLAEDQKDHIPAVGYWRRAEKTLEFLDYLQQDGRARLVSIDVHGDGMVRFGVDLFAFDGSALTEE